MTAKEKATVGGQSDQKSSGSPSLVWAICFKPPLPPLQAIFIWAVRIKNVGEQINIAILFLANIFFFCLFKIKDYGDVFQQSISSQHDTHSGFPLLYREQETKADT